MSLSSMMLLLPLCSSIAPHGLSRNRRRMVELFPFRTIHDPAVGIPVGPAKIEKSWRLLPPEVLESERTVMLAVRGTNPLTGLSVFGFPRLPPKISNEPVRLIVDAIPYRCSPSDSECPVPCRAVTAAWTAKASSLDPLPEAPQCIGVGDTPAKSAMAQLPSASLICEPLSPLPLFSEQAEFV